MDIPVVSVSLKYGLYGVGIEKNWSAPDYSVNEEVKVQEEGVHLSSDDGDETIQKTAPAEDVSTSAKTSSSSSFTKEARTLFRSLSYDAETDTSLVHCLPQTGRTHQIRVSANRTTPC